MQQALVSFEQAQRFKALAAKGCWCWLEGGECDVCDPVVFARRVLGVEVAPWQEEYMRDRGEPCRCGHSFEDHCNAACVQHCARCGCQEFKAQQKAQQSVS